MTSLVNSIKYFKNVYQSYTTFGFSSGTVVKKKKICLLMQDGEGNGTPLQYSCLEDPMDGGAWWAAVHGVAKS